MKNLQVNNSYQVSKIELPDQVIEPRQYMTVAPYIMDCVQAKACALLGIQTQLDLPEKFLETAEGDKGVFCIHR